MRKLSEPENTQPANDSSLNGMRLLTTLTIGNRATISEVKGSDDEQQILARIGIVAGTSICVIKGGDPALVRVNGAKVALRQVFLEKIIVDCPHAAAPLTDSPTPTASSQASLLSLSSFPSRG